MNDQHPRQTFCGLIIMGVAGSGKTSLGVRLATLLKMEFIDGDELHPPANVQKMAAGIPLDDHDREPWLRRISEQFDTWEQRGTTGIIACSALKKKYRDQIRAGKGNRLFLFLDGTYDLIYQRLLSRQGHFMRPQMLRSQFETLELPEHEPDVIRLAVDVTLDELVEQAMNRLAAVNFPNRSMVPPKQES